VWRPLHRAIEARWEERFDKDIIGNLREELSTLVSQLDPAMPDCMPILGYGLWSKRNVKTQVQVDETALPFYTLLSRPLLAFAEEFETHSPLSLAICANVLRVFDSEEIPVRDLPVRSGISKEVIQVAMGFLAKAGFIRLETVNRTKIARLTERGGKARNEYRRLVDEIEKNWRARFGEKAIANLRRSLEQLAGDGTFTAPLFRAIEPYPDGWRASVPRPGTLPHFPAVTHRGGYPDGS
jgi:predicted transcriptional regulator